MPLKEADLIQVRQRVLQLEGDPNFLDCPVSKVIHESGDGVRAGKAEMTERAE